MYFFKAIARLLTVKNNKIFWQSLGIVCRLRLGIIIGQASLSDWLHCRRGIINWQASTFVRHHCTGIIRQAPLYRHCCLTIFIVREASSTQASIGQASSTDRHHWTGIIGQASLDRHCCLTVFIVGEASSTDKHQYLSGIIEQASLDRHCLTVFIVGEASSTDRQQHLSGIIALYRYHCTGINGQASLDRHHHQTSIILRQAPLHHQTGVIIGQAL